MERIGIVERLKTLKLKRHNSLIAVVIDPVNRSVLDCRVPCDFEVLKSHVIGCDLAEVVDLGENVDAWVDEEGAYKPWDEVGVVRLVGQLQLFGVVVLLGRDDCNDMADLPKGIDAELVEGMCHWLDPKKVVVPGPTMTTIGKDGQPVTERLGPDLTYQAPPRPPSDATTGTGRLITYRKRRAYKQN